MERNIGYTFNNRDILKTALIHSSAVNPCHAMSNQRLEFLGDAVLQLAVSDYLYRVMNEDDEGALSKCRSLIVCSDSLFIASKEIGLNRFIVLGKGEELSGGRDKKNILADAFESLVGGIYLDGGFEAAARFVMDKLDAIIHTAVAGRLHYDYKTMLQEYVQSHNLGALTYELVGITGPEHDQRFCSRAVVNAYAYPSGSGRSRKQSEQQAAQNALEEMQIIGLKGSDA